MKFVILHGTSSNHDSNWFPWLKSELEALGHKVWVPDLPDSDMPNIDKYNEFLISSGWDFNNNILIGHSSGAVAINGLLQELTDNVNVEAAILVGSFRGDLGWDSLHGVDIPFDFNKIKNKSRRFFVIHSDNDPYCPVEGAQWISEKLGAEFMELSNMQHFSYQLDKKFAKFPELLDLIKDKVLS